MSCYILDSFKGSKTLYPKHSYNTEEVLHENNDFCLDKFFVEDGLRHTFSRYRLHTRKPYRFYDTMDFDIKCPRCGDILRLCGNPVDTHNHGLYRCRRCDDEQRR